MGKHAEARPYYERALKIRENALWPEHRDLVGNLRELGMLLVEQEFYEEAQPYLERAAEINEQALGDHPDTAQSLDSLGRVLALPKRLTKVPDPCMSTPSPSTSRSWENRSALPSV
jgi:tetratricopeptide (TPR) repeat protein